MLPHTCMYISSLNVTLSIYTITRYERFMTSGSHVHACRFRARQSHRCTVFTDIFLCQTVSDTYCSHTWPLHAKRYQRSEPSVNTRIEKVYETTRFFVSLWLPNEHNIHTLHIVCAYIAHLLSSTFVNLKCMLIERWVCVDVQCNHVYVTPACQGKKDVMIVFNANLYYLCITVDNFPRLEHVSLTSWRL